MLKKILLSLAVLTTSLTYGKILVLATASLLDIKYEMRKQEYIKSLKILNQLGYDFYCVENIKNENEKTFLDDYCDKVYYSHSNDFTIKGNKGINELKALKAAIDYFNFDENDIVVKITGRYCFDNNNFFKLIESNPNFDAFVRYGKP